MQLAETRSPRLADLLSLAHDVMSERFSLRNYPDFVHVKWTGITSYGVRSSLDRLPTAEGLSPNRSLAILSESKHGF